MNVNLLESFNQKFKEFANYAQVVNYLADLGMELSLSSNEDPTIQTAKNLYPGCETPLYLTVERTGTHNEFKVYTTSITLRGLVYIVFACMNSLEDQEINTIKFSDFSDITQHLNVQHKKNFQVILNAALTSIKEQS